MKRGMLKRDREQIAAWKARSRKPLKRSERPQNRRVSPSEAQSKGSGRGKPQKAQKQPKPRLSAQTAEIAFNRFSPCGNHHKARIVCICGCGRYAKEWHHVFDQTHYPELADEADNVVPVASQCHSAHTGANRRLPRAICRYAERGLAVTPQMEAYLDRVYGPRED